MKKKGLIISIVGVVIIAITVALVLLLPGKSSKEVYTAAVKKSLGLSSIDKIKETIDYEKVLKDNIIKVTLDTEGVSVDEEKGNRTFTEKMLLYVGKDNLYLTGNSLVNNKTINFEAALKDNKLYIFVKDILTKYYYTDMSATGTTQGMPKIDIEKILNYLSDSIVETIESDKVKKESTDLTIDGKNYKVDRYSHTFTGEHLYKAVTEFIKKIKNDSELTSQLTTILKSSNVNGTTVSLDDLFNLLTQQTESFKSLGDLFTYTLYLDGDEILSKVISVDITFGEQKMPIALTINSTDSFKEIYVSAMGQKMYDFTVKNTSENNADISLKMLGQDVASGKLVKTDNSISVTLSGKVTNDSQFSLDANIKKISDTQIEGTIKVVSGDSHATYNIKTEKVEEVPSVDLSNSAPIEQMPESEKNALQAVLGELYPGSNLSFGGNNIISG
jgi:hypothetical protein